MNLLKSVREKFGGKSVNFQEEHPQGYNAPENFNILVEKVREFYLESGSVSISMLQEQFDISYYTGAMVMKHLDEEGLFGEENDEDLEWEYCQK